MLFGRLRSYNSVRKRTINLNRIHKALLAGPGRLKGKGDYTSIFMPSLTRASLAAVASSPVPAFDTSLFLGGIVIWKQNDREASGGRAVSFVEGGQWDRGSLQFCSKS
jgi:hypothetical protein